jgi:TATA-box binding protein (TBP) (component of TFIID and TFIIIB)
MTNGPTINDEWEKYFQQNDMENEYDIDNDAEETAIPPTDEYNDITKYNYNETVSSPKFTDLYISTTTTISYLNIPIDIHSVFWDIPIMLYSTPKEGVVKKQMKFVCTSQEDLDIILAKKNKYECVDELIISKNPTSDRKPKFKDVRKISIGLSRKDIISYRCKKKGAFMNCFVVILRLLYKDVYKEIHVKVFNTGKLEIPGIQNDVILNKVLTLLVEILTPIVKTDIPLIYMKDKNETVLINSNFNCGYYIDREKLYKKLKYTYKINSVYDPCSYPGIQCEFYYESSLEGKHDATPIVNAGTNKVSFMIFRTGSVLIVGKCSQEIIYKIYDFLCDILNKEYVNIKGINNDVALLKPKPLKNRKKHIVV